MVDALKTETIAAEGEVEIAARLVSAQRVVADLETRCEIATRTVEKLIADRKPFAFQASQGDAVAQKELDRRTQEQFHAEHNARDLRYALGEARAHLTAAVQGTHEAEANRLLNEAKKIAIESCGHAGKFDEHLIAAAAELRALEDCRKRLAKTGALDATFLNRLASKFAVQHAMAATSLSKYFDYVGAASKKTLHESVKGALSAIRRPSLNADAPSISSTCST
jgi:hypothetical protein